jgi:hypothetical protein
MKLIGLKRLSLGLGGPTLLLLFALACGPAMAAPAGSAFTYQGRLSDHGAPANGSYDLRFVLYDAVSGGNQAGPTFTNLATAVSNGIFTVSLDFGTVFDGNGRWLEVSVCTNGANNFIMLLPRQNVAPAPYALTTLSLAGILPDSQLSPNIARVSTVSSAIVAATNALLPAVTNIVIAASSNLNASALTSGLVPGARLTGVSITNGVRYFWNNVIEPYWTYNQFGRATLLDMTDSPLMTLRHNDIGSNNNVIYFGGAGYWDAASVQLRGTEDGNANPRFTIVFGLNERYTWRFRETNFMDGNDVKLLSHDNSGNVILGNTNGSGTIRGTNVVLESALTIVTNHLALGGHLTSAAGPGIYFGTTNAPTFAAPAGSLYLTSASNGIMYFRTNGNWIIK